MKKILYYSETSEFGGAEVALVNLVKNIDRTKFEPVCIFRASRHRKRIEDSLPGIKKYFIPMLISYPSILYILLKERPDIVHLNMHVPFSCFFMIAAAKVTGVSKLIASVASNVAPYSRFRIVIKIKSFLAKIFLPLVGFFVCVSYKSKDELIRNYDIDPGRTSVIYNGIDIDTLRSLGPGELADARRALGAGEKDIIIGTVSRLVRNKGIEYLLESFKTLSNKYENLLLLVVGGGNLLEHYKKMADGMGLNCSVRFTGFVEDKERLLCLMDIFVQASLSEGLSISLAEAMACRKPVVATDVGGTSELVSDGVTGILVPAKNEKALVDALSGLVDNEGSRKSMGFEGRKRIESDFKPSKTHEHYYAIYNREIKAIFDKKR